MTSSDAERAPATHPPCRSRSPPAATLPAQSTQGPDEAPAARTGSSAHHGVHAVHQRPLASRLCRIATRAAPPRGPSHAAFDDPTATRSPPASWRGGPPMETRARMWHRRRPRRNPRDRRQHRSAARHRFVHSQAPGFAERRRQDEEVAHPIQRRHTALVLKRENCGSQRGPAPPRTVFSPARRHQPEPARGRAAGRLHRAHELQGTLFRLELAREQEDGLIGPDSQLRAPARRLRTASIFSVRRTA